METFQDPPDLRGYGESAQSLPIHGKGFVGDLLKAWIVGTSESIEFKMIRLQYIRMTNVQAAADLSHYAPLRFVSGNPYQPDSRIYLGILSRQVRRWSFSPFVKVINLRLVV